MSGDADSAAAAATSATAAGDAATATTAASTTADTLTPPDAAGTTAGATAAAVAPAVQLPADQIVIDVWDYNLDEEMAKISDVLELYPYIAMDTEFPGVVTRPIGSFKNHLDYHYQTLKCNVDMLTLIQVGFCFTDARGRRPTSTPSCWQFHFKFDLATDMYAQDAIEQLVASGIDFARHERQGINTAAFGECLMDSGVVLNDDVQWVTFHAGYDYGYLLRILTGMQPLPKQEHLFVEQMRLYFPRLYDVKYMMQMLHRELQLTQVKAAEADSGASASDAGKEATAVKNAAALSELRGGLNALAESLSVERHGPKHQAGSDAAVTAAAFFALCRKHYADTTGADLDARCLNKLYGLSNYHKVKWGASEPSATRGVHPLAAKDGK